MQSKEILLSSESFLQMIRSFLQPIFELFQAFSLWQILFLPFSQQQRWKNRLKDETFEHVITKERMEESEAESFPFLPPLIFPLSYFQMAVNSCKYSTASIKLQI